jgi:hypothetical protein
MPIVFGVLALGLDGAAAVKAIAAARARSGAAVQRGHAGLHRRGQPRCPRRMRHG